MAYRLSHTGGVGRTTGIVWYGRWFCTMHHWLVLHRDMSDAGKRTRPSITGFYSLSYIPGFYYICSGPISAISANERVSILPRPLGHSLASVSLITLNCAGSMSKTYEVGLDAQALRKVVYVPLPMYHRCFHPLLPCPRISESDL